MKSSAAALTRGTVDDQTIAEPRLNWRASVPVVVLLALVTLAVVPAIASLKETVAAFAGLAAWAIVAAIGAQAISYVGTAFSLRAIARLSGDALPLSNASRYAVASGSVGLLAGGPLGYGPFTFYWMRAAGISAEGSILCSSLPALFNSVTLMSFNVAGVIAFASLHILSRLQVALLALAVAVPASVVGLVLWTLADGERWLPLVRGALRLGARVAPPLRDPRVVSSLTTRMTLAHQYLHGGGSWRAFGGAAVCAIADFATLCFACLAAHRTPTPGFVFTLFALPHLLGRITALPGGIGAVEGGMVGLCALMGVPASTGIAITLVYRAISFWLPIAVGVPVAVSLQHAAAAGTSVRNVPTPAYARHG